MTPGCVSVSSDSPLEQKDGDDDDDDEDHSQDWTHDPEHLWLLGLSAHSAVERHHGLREGTGCEGPLPRGGNTVSLLVNDEEEQLLFNLITCLPAAEGHPQVQARPQQIRQTCC